MSFNDDDNSKSGSQSFSDTDLKRLKEDMRPKKPWDYVRFDPDKIMALLTRLEASEKLSTYYARHKDFCGLAEITPSYRCELCEAIEAWYKACGRDK